MKPAVREALSWLIGIPIGFILIMAWVTFLATRAVRAGVI